MKKVFFLAMLTLCCIACSDSDNSFTPNPEDVGVPPEENVDLPILKVSVDALLEGLSESKTRSAAVGVSDLFEYDQVDQRLNTLKYVVYDATSGAVVTEGLKKIEDVQFGLSLELKKGKYQLAAMVASEHSGIDINYTAKNYKEDFCVGNSMRGNIDNKDVYFETIEWDVNEESSKTPIKLALKPMWSHYCIVINNVNDMKLPAGTAKLQLKMSPVKYGFYIQSKLAKDSGEYPFLELSQTIEKIKNQAGFPMRLPLYCSQTEKAVISLGYLDAEDNELGKTVIFKGDIVAGKRIVFSGDLSPQKEVIFKCELSPLKVLNVTK